MKTRLWTVSFRVLVLVQMETNVGEWAAVDVLGNYRRCLHSIVVEGTCLTCRLVQEMGSQLQRVDSSAWIDSQNSQKTSYFNLTSQKHHSQSHYSYSLHTHRSFINTVLNINLICHRYTYFVFIIIKRIIILKTKINTLISMFLDIICSILSELLQEMMRIACLD